MENYEQKYNKALNVIESLYNVVRYQSSTDALFASQTIEKAFPELKEREDEKIRKEIIQSIQDNMCVIHKDKCIAWLEKQGEQYNKVEPKFKVGDKIIRKELGGDFIHNPHKIIQVDMLDKKYRLEDGLVAHFSEEDDWELVEQKPSWSEEDIRNIQDIDSILFYDRRLTEDIRTRLRNFLKSLEPIHWKPSEEQMEALKKRTHGLHKSSETRKALESLINDLKKL